MMSLAVIAYQLLIFTGIVFTGLIGGRLACIATIIMAVLWTCTHVFWLPLMLLQFGTILLASLISLPLAWLHDWLVEQWLSSSPNTNNDPKDTPPIFRQPEPPTQFATKENHVQPPIKHLR